MAKISTTTVQNLLRRGDNAKTTSEKGRALEDLICYVFERVPGVTIGARRATNPSGSEEIDIAFWNRMHHKGFYFLPNIILVECKNWSQTVGSSEVDWFSSKLRRRALTFGILVAANGVTGNSSDTSAAHDIISDALREGRRLVVLTRTELEELRDTGQLIELIQRKYCELAVLGTVFS